MKLGAREVTATQRPVHWIDPVSGIAFEVKPTGWTDANGVYGYLRVPGGQGTVQTMKLDAREQASKTEEQHP